MRPGGLLPAWPSYNERATHFSTLSYRCSVLLEASGRRLVDESILSPIGGDIPRPLYFQNQSSSIGLCDMAITANGSCVLQTYNVVENNVDYFGRAFVFCRNDGTTNPVDGVGGSWELKGGLDDMIVSGTESEYCAADISANGSRVALGNSEAGTVDIYDYTSNYFWNLTQRINGTTFHFGSALTMDAAGQKLVVGDSNANSFFAYENTGGVGAVSFSQVYSASHNNTYAESIDLKQDGSAFVVVKEEDRQVDLFDWSTFESTTFTTSTPLANTNGRIFDARFSSDGTRLAIAANDGVFVDSGNLPGLIRDPSNTFGAAFETLPGDRSQRWVEIHEIHGAATHMGLHRNAVLSLGTALYLSNDALALNMDGQVLAIGVTDWAVQVRHVFLYQLDTISGSLVSIATQELSARAKNSVRLSSDARTMFVSGRNPNDGIGVRAFDVDVDVSGTHDESLPFASVCQFLTHS